MFNQDQIAYLEAPLDRANVATRSQSGRNLSYIEGWFAIKEANRIFGFDAWNRETIDIRLINEKPRRIGQGNKAKDGFGVSYFAKVRITIGNVIREGCGTGHGIDADLGLAHESALKEAETDAMKRALITFGNPFGLALYDKTQSEVETNPAPVMTTHEHKAFFERIQAMAHKATDVSELNALFRAHQREIQNNNFAAMIVEKFAVCKAALQEQEAS